MINVRSWFVCAFFVYHRQYKHYNVHYNKAYSPDIFLLFILSQQNVASTSSIKIISDDDQFSLADYQAGSVYCKFSLSEFNAFACK